MRLGLQVSYFSWPGAPASIGPTFGRIARNAEQAGLASLWVMDHFFQIHVIGPSELDMVEGYTALAFAAGQTSRIELGTLVTGVTYRHPGLLAKTVTSLDVLSGGRAWLGIGAAWNEEEHRGLGVPYPPTKERFERLEETLQICLQMWAGDDSPYVGRHYELERPLNVPQSLRRPHPPILIGGGGEKKTLRLVAQYADACNLFDMGLGPEGIPRKLDIIREHCEAVGRDYAEIEKTVLARVTLSRDGSGTTTQLAPVQTVDQAVGRFGRLSDAGVDTILLGMGNDTDDEAYELVAEVVRQVEPLTAPDRQASS
jgi:F420-dependent oxidoreductase-like protein